ncbi:MAG: phage terminase large subunit [Pseudomonadota bacterium]
MNAPVAISPPFRLTAKQEEQRRLAAGRARYVLAYGGSRAAKTFGFCGLTATRAMKAAGSKHLIFRKTIASVKTSIAGKNGTLPTYMRLRHPGYPIEYKSSEGRFELPNGAEIWLGGLDAHNLEKILGNEYSTIFGNELSEIPFGTFETMETRLAETALQDSGEPLKQVFYGDLNPTTRAHWTYKTWVDLVHPLTQELLDPELYAYLQMNPSDNVENLSPEYLASLQKLGTRAKKRFWDGNYAADVEEALWRRSMIQRTQRDVRDLKRIVVAIDPSVSNQPGSDETGIIAAGVDDANVAYVLADDSGRMRPEDWARRAVALYHQLGADRVVAEVNNGGDLVENQIRAFDAYVSFRAVHASRGKAIRAEPIAALYERGKVYHCDRYDALEDQMCSFTVDFDRVAMGISPDRVDALVWALSDLFGVMTKKKAPDKPAPPQRPAGPQSWLQL